LISLLLPCYISLAVSPFASPQSPICTGTFDFPRTHFKIARFASRASHSYHQTHPSSRPIPIRHRVTSRPQTARSAPKASPGTRQVFPQTNNFDSPDSGFLERLSLIRTHRPFPVPRKESRGRARSSPIKSGVVACSALLSIDLTTKHQFFTRNRRFPLLSPTPSFSHLPNEQLFDSFSSIVHSFVSYSES